MMDFTDQQSPDSSPIHAKGALQTLANLMPRRKRPKWNRLRDQPFDYMSACSRRVPLLYKRDVPAGARLA